MITPKGFNSLSNHPNFIKSKPGKELSKNPLGFIDIGARGGAHDVVEPVANCTAVLGFDLDNSECERLLTIPAVYEPWATFSLESIALADKNGEAELHSMNCITNDSLLSPNAEFTKRYNMVKWQEVSRAKLMTSTLDSVLFEKRNSDQIIWGEFIKLDTQGTEYEILVGGKKTLLERSVAIMTEVSFCEIYQDQKLFSEIEIFLRSLGFSFYGFMPIRGRSRKFLNKKTHATLERALYVDAIFLKDPLAGGPCKYSLSERQIYVLFTCCLLLGYYDFALELAKETWLKISTAEEAYLIKELIEELSALPIVNAQKSVMDLVNAVKNNPELSNIAIGDFVDRRRKLCDYDDVLNVNPLPTTR